MSKNIRTYFHNERSIAYAEYGLPSGKPVFFFHGMPGSRFFRPPDSITTRLGVRLITVDRPGYGGSDFQPGRRIVDWPGVVTNLADLLGITKFAVAGHSGGGPYALACAEALPERVTAAGSLSGAGPIDTPGVTVGLSRLHRLGLKYGRYIPWFLWKGLIWLTYHRKRDDPATEMDHGDGRRPAADDEQIHKPEVRQACLDSEIEAFKQGLNGLAWDARLLTRPWGFSLENIKVPVFIWHGEKDDLVSLAMAQSMVEKIPDSHLILCKGEAHLLLINHWEEILLHLTSE